MFAIDTQKVEETTVAECLSPGRRPDDLDARIADCAYYKAEKRGFMPGYEMDDWYEAEKDILESLALASRSFGLGLRD